MTVNEAVIIWNHPHNRGTAITAVRFDKALEQMIREEIARLADNTGSRILIEHDHISRDRHKALTALLAAAQENAA